jgi:hypothetical protein
MNKYVKIIGIAALIGIVALAALAGAAVALAQSVNPTPTPSPFGGYGPGMMGGGYGMMGYGAGMMDGYGYGFMAEYRDVIHAKVAGALGMTLDEFNAALASGKTPYSIAQEKGIDFATVQAAMQAGMVEALKQAVADGKITQAQADAMLSHHTQMSAWYANGGSPMAGHGRGMMGLLGARGYNGACPFANATPAP